MKRVLFGTIGAIAIALSFASNAPAQTNTTIDPTTLLLQKQIKLQRYQLEQQQLQLEQQQLMLNKLMAAEIRNQADIKQAKADAGEARKQVALVSSRADTSAVKTATTVGSLNPGFGNIPTGPGWRSSDGSDEIQLGGLLQLDGGINNYHPGSSAVTFRKLTNNLNVRRGQISLRVTFLNDFKGFLLYDFGGVNDTLGASQSFVNSDGKTVATVTGNAIKTGFQDAILSYTGFKPFGTMTSIDLGYETPPITQDEAISPSQAMFMEHPVVDLSYVKIGAGNARGILGFRDYTNRYFGFFALSGPTSSALHDQSQTGTPLVAIGRLDYNIVNQAMTKVQIGGSFQRYLQTPGANAVSLGGLSEDFDDFA